jgi:hypothetical protein
VRWSRLGSLPLLGKSAFPTPSTALEPTAVTLRSTAAAQRELLGCKSRLRIGAITRKKAPHKTMWVTGAFDTAGEVLHALVRSIRVAMISYINMEVSHAASDADRARPT